MRSVQFYEDVLYITTPTTRGTCKEKFKYIKPYDNKYVSKTQLKVLGTGDEVYRVNYTDTCYYKEITNIPHQIKYIRELFPDGVSGNTRVGFIDIETTMEYGSVDIVNCPESITLITVNENTFEGDTEEEILLNFYKYLEEYPYHILTGWNVNFDIKYIYSRSLRYGLAHKLSPFGKVFESKRVIIMGVQVLDYMSLYIKFVGTPLSSYSLDYVTKHELGEGKQKHSYSTIEDLRTNDYELYKQYNRKDVALLIALDNKLKLIDLALKITETAGVNPEDVFYPTVLWDAIIYNDLLDIGILAPPKAYSNDNAEPYEGGYVHEPTPGRIFEGVQHYDVSSMYPSIIIMLNMSPEVDVTNNINNINDITNTTNGLHFDKGRVGVIPMRLKKLIHDRNKFKKAGDTNGAQAYKILVNSLYGALANVRFRYYNLEYAKCITETGRDIIKLCIDKLGNCLYADTDSVYLQGDECQIELDNICRNIENSYNGFNDIIKFKYEGAIERIYFFAKKKYMYIRDGKFNTRGLVTNRATSSDAVRKGISNIYELILRGASSEDALSRYNRFFDEFRTFKIEDICAVTKVESMGIRKITDKGTPAHIRACLVHNELFPQRDRIRDGDKILWAYTQEGSKYDVVAFKVTAPEAIKIDVDKQFDNLVNSPLGDIFKFIYGINLAELNDEQVYLF